MPKIGKNWIISDLQGVLNIRELRILTLEKIIDSFKQAGIRSKNNNKKLEWITEKKVIIL